MTTPPAPPRNPLAHHAVRMGGRDPHEEHRAATPLELLFDLTFVIAFGLAAAQFAHALADAHYSAGLIGFGFASFAICWAWINFSWFASAYDTDDWIFRVVTMVQMIGVLVLAIGLPRMFASIEHGEQLDNSASWCSAMSSCASPWCSSGCARRGRIRPPPGLLTYVSPSLSRRSAGWHRSSSIFRLPPTFVFDGSLLLIEMTGPVIAERRDGGTPWHAHHIAERYSLFAIIALGEGVVGTVATLSAAVEDQGWTLDAALVCIAGTGLTFGMWWVYYMLPCATVLHAHRNRAFVWGYGHMLIVVHRRDRRRAACRGLFHRGQGAYRRCCHRAHRRHAGGSLSLSIYALYYYLVRRFDPFHIWLLAGTPLVVATAVVAAVAGVSMAVCLIILMFAPMSPSWAMKSVGHRHKMEAIARAIGKPS